MHRIRKLNKSDGSLPWGPCNSNDWLKFKSWIFWQTLTSFSKTEKEELVSLLTFPFTFLNLSVWMTTASAGQPPLQGKISMNHQLWMKEISSNWWDLTGWSDIHHPSSFRQCCQSSRNFSQVTATKINYWLHCLRDELRQIIIIFLPHGFTTTTRGGGRGGEKAKKPIQM